MACNEDTQVNRVPGDWIKMTNQGPPPNATAADRRRATQSASKAADEAAAAHCEMGQCGEGSRCAAQPDRRATRVYEFEETKTPNGWFIRALCSMRYHCECEKLPKDGNGDKDKPPKKKK